MANTQSKVEKLGLAKVVNAMLAAGVKSAREITRRLRADGYTISDSAVNRYVNKVGIEAKDQAFDIIKEHVDRVVPEDLDALEVMESQCLKWANEDPKEAALRLADARLAVDGQLDFWADMLKVSADENERNQTIKKIVRACMQYVMSDARLQSKRIQAMITAIKIIDLKLAKAGLLTDDGKGRIIIYDKSADYRPTQPGESPEQRRETFRVRIGGTP